MGDTKIEVLPDVSSGSSKSTCASHFHDMVESKPRLSTSSCALGKGRGDALGPPDITHSKNFVFFSFPAGVTFKNRMNRKCSIGGRAPFVQIPPVLFSVSLFRSGRRRKTIEMHSSSSLPYDQRLHLGCFSPLSLSTLTGGRALLTISSKLLWSGAFPPKNRTVEADWPGATETPKETEQMSEKSRQNGALEKEEIKVAHEDGRKGGEFHNDALVNVLREAVGLPSTEEIKNMIMGAKNAKEVQHLLEHVVYRHHLAADPLNGHGYRVAILQALTAVAPRTVCLTAWWDAVQRFRPLGFLLTRAFVAEGFTTLRHWLTQQFDRHGRSPYMVVDGIRYIRDLLYWCKEDKLVLDHVIYTRIIFLLTMIVSFMDRHNLYRSSFSSGDFVKRDGIVVEWVLSTERCVDFDETVLQCDAFLEEVLSLLREDITSRPTFNIFYRLADYYFATDNVEKMLSVMEEAEEAGVPVAESTTAKLMQLSCALNHPATPALFLRWRVALPHCLIATPDISRLLFYFSRSGGGYPCPICGEIYNHRNASVYVWLETPPHQRNCPALQMGRKRKGELEECRELPHNKDWSKEAWGLWKFSAERSIEWGAVEWRGFLLCCMFGSPSAASRTGYPPPLDGKALLDRHLPPERMDDFLRATYMRFLRHHQPHLAAEIIQHWLSLGTFRMSPIALQEALMCAACILTTEELQILREIQEGEAEGQTEERSGRKGDDSFIFSLSLEGGVENDSPLEGAGEVQEPGGALPPTGIPQGDVDSLSQEGGRLMRKVARKPVCTPLLSLGVVELREDLALDTSVDPSSWQRRYKDLQFIWKAIQEKDTYVMPFTKRVLRARQRILQEIWKKQQQQWEGKTSNESVDSESEDRKAIQARKKEAEAHFAAEQSLLETIIMMTPRNLSLLDMKDSASDFAVGSTRKNVFIPS